MLGGAVGGLIVSWFGNGLNGRGGYGGDGAAVAVGANAVLGMAESEKGRNAPLFMRLTLFRYLYAIAYGVLGITI